MQNHSQSFPIAFSPLAFPSTVSPPTQRFGAGWSPQLKRQFSQSWALCWALILVAATCGGCGGSAEYETIDTFPAKGRITVNGVPAKGAIVRLYPESPQAGSKYALMPSGKANSEGIYQLTTYENADGAPAGRYKVTIEWPDPDWRPPGGGMPPPPPDRLKGRFSDPETSEIEVTVVEGENELEPIVLEDVPILAGSSLPK